MDVSFLLQAQANRNPLAEDATTASQANKAAVAQAAGTASAGAEQASGSAKDQVSLTPVDSQGAQQVLYARLSVSIKISLRVGGEGAEAAAPDLSQFDPADWTPQSVADRILAFAQKFLDQTQSPEEYNAVLSQIKEGISAGLAQSREILDGLNAMTEEVSANISLTEQLLQEGVDLMETMPERLLSTMTEA